MTLKKLSSPSSGTEDKVYGEDWNNLVDLLQGGSSGQVFTGQGVGNDPTWSSDLNVNDITANNVQVGDLNFKNNWKITEDLDYGLVLVSPNGKRYRFRLEEIRSHKKRSRRRKR